MKSSIDKMNEGMGSGGVGELGSTGTQEPGSRGAEEQGRKIFMRLDVRSSGTITSQRIR